MKAEHTMNLSTELSVLLVQGTKNSQRKSPWSIGSSLLYNQRRTCKPADTGLHCSTRTGAGALLLITATAAAVPQPWQGCTN
mmetsp:Transcript_17722/g.35754  ORF Transcript_17722/g.35754 Transcript_17722/m.35754 type:complete len:82 (-) Transcript_17722:196-441(-)